MRIALDAMGGDYAPIETVRGAVEAARAYGIEVLLVGQEEAVLTELARYDTSGLRIRIVGAGEVVGMGEHPIAAVRNKKNSSLAVGIDLVKSGEADALVSAGNSGAVMAAALFGLGRMPGIERPAIGALLPTMESPVLVIDVGANADCRPGHLLQFGMMGSAYMERIGGLPRPRVGLLSNGEEATKGSQLVQEAHGLLRSSGLNFVGNVEGKDVTRGAVDVLVTDGFTGNIVLKWGEGAVELFLSLLRQTLNSRWHYRLATKILKPALLQVAARLDYSERGGAPLLGVEGVVIVAHGRSDAQAIKSALRTACLAVDSGVVAAIREALLMRGPFTNANNNSKGGSKKGQ